MIEVRWLACIALHTHKNAKIYLGIKTLLLEFLQDAVVGCPQHIVDLGHLVQLIGSREERIQTETEGNYNNLTAKQQSYLHSFLKTSVKPAVAYGMHTYKRGKPESEALFSF